MKLLAILLLIPSFLNASDYSEFFKETQDAQERASNTMEDFKKNIAPFLKNKDSKYNGLFHKFVLADKDSFLARVTVEKVKFFADVADFVYKDKFKKIQNIHKELVLQFPLLFPDSGYSIQGTVERNGGTELSALFLYNKDLNHLVIVFRGSVTLNDWISNAQFLNYAGPDHLKALTTLNNKKLNVHSGIATTYLEGVPAYIERLREFFYNHLSDLIDSKTPLDITTVGHSLGGALAVLLANSLPSFLLDIGSEICSFIDPASFKIATISFGAPRVFDLDSSIAVENNLGGKQNILCFVDEADPVPDLPLKSMKRANIGLRIYIPATKEAIAAKLAFLAADIVTGKIVSNTAFWFGQQVRSLFLSPTVDPQDEPMDLMQSYTSSVKNPFKHTMANYKSASPRVFGDIKEGMDRAYTAFEDIENFVSFMPEWANSKEYISRRKIKLDHQLASGVFKSSYLLAAMEKTKNQEVIDRLLPILNKVVDSNSNIEAELNRLKPESKKTVSPQPVRLIQ